MGGRFRRATGRSARIAFACGALALAPACSRPTHAPPITGDELAARIHAGDAPLVVDVRPRAEYAAGHVPDALNIPEPELADRIGELGIEDRGREIVLYCGGGDCAKAARRLLRHAGFSDVRHLEGDISAWRETEHPCRSCG